MKKYVVTTDAISLVVNKGSVVILSEKQYELAKGSLEPLADSPSKSKKKKEEE